MVSSRIVAVEPVRMEAPAELVDELRDFYLDVAMLEELPVVDQEPGLRFGSEQTELRIRFCSTPTIDSVALRTTIGIPSIEDLVEKLEDREIAFQRLTGLVYTDRRVQTCDPAGNRIDFKRQWPRVVF